MDMQKSFSLKTRFDGVFALILVCLCRSSIMKELLLVLKLKLSLKAT